MIQKVTICPIDKRECTAAYPSLRPRRHPNQQE